MAGGGIASRPAPGAFHYHRSIAPMMWVLVALSAVELLVVHLLISHWSRMAALLLSTLSLAAIGWIVLLIRSFRRLPVILEDDRLLMRVGGLKRIDIPLAQIAGLRASADMATLKQRSTLNLALIAYPNILIDLTAPVRAGRREIMLVAHKLDRPEVFSAALAEVVRSRSAG